MQQIHQDKSAAQMFLFVVLFTSVSHTDLHLSADLIT